MLGKIRAEFGVVSDRADVDRKALIFVHEPAWKPLDVEVYGEVYGEFVFVSLFRGFFLSSCPPEQTIKSSPRKGQCKETRWHGLDIFVKASVLNCTTAMPLDERRGTGTENTERSLNLKKKKTRKTLLLLFIKVEAELG